MSKILVTGVAGQAGSILVDLLLLDPNNKVYGLKRRSSTNNLCNLQDALKCQNFHLIEGDITDCHFINKLVKEEQFDKIFNMAAVAHVHYSFDHPRLNYEVNTLGVLNFLEAMRYHSQHTRILNAGTSECFGSNYREVRSDLLHTNGQWDGGLMKVQDFQVPFSPNSPYSCAKSAAFDIIKLYRKSYGLWCVQPISFNMESGRRSSDYLTMKVIEYVVRLKLGLVNEKLVLGNLDASRDWSYCPDIMRGYMMLMDRDEPKEYVFASGHSYTVRDFVKRAFNLINEDYNNHIVISEKFYRPCEVPYLCGNYYLAKKELGWEPVKSLDDIILEMYNSTLNKMINDNNCTLRTVLENVVDDKVSVTWGPDIPNG